MSRQHHGFFLLISLCFALPVESASQRLAANVEFVPAISITSINTPEVLSNKLAVGNEQARHTKAIESDGQTGAVFINPQGQSAYLSVVGSTQQIRQAVRLSSPTCQLNGGIEEACGVSDAYQIHSMSAHPLEVSIGMSLTILEGKRVGKFIEVYDVELIFE